MTTTKTSPPVYLIAAPHNRAGRLWDHRLTRIRALVPHVTVTDWSKLPAPFRAIPSADQPARLAKALTGAIVVPWTMQDRLWIGRHALKEIAAFVAEDKTVYVFTGSKLTRWQECAVTRPDVGPRYTPIEIITEAAK